MTILDLDKFATEHHCETDEELIFILRQHYSTAATIAALASTELRSADPVRLAYCDREMAWFFDDLGNCFYDSFDGVRNALANGSRLATEPTTSDMRGRFSGMPAIVLGAGPGAADRWDAIKASRGHAVLIVCDVMLGACLERGIIPDFVSAQERTPFVYESMQGLDKDGITLLAPPVIERRVVDDFDGRVVWCWRGCGLEVWIDKYAQRNNFGRSCGVQGLGAALLAGCSPIYLVGHDLCMDGERTHAPGAAALTGQTTANIACDSDEYHRKQAAKSIRGRDVTTTHLWLMFKSDIEHIAKEHPWCRVINTGDGLPIEATLAGEIPTTWGNTPVGCLQLTRKHHGNDPAQMVALMLADIPAIETRCREIMAAVAPNYQRLQLTTMVDVLTAGAWTEIYGSTYVSALIRMHLQPTQQVVMLRRVANTVLHTLPHVRRCLERIRDTP